MKKSLLLSLSLLAFPLMASTALTSEQEARVRELVRETLVSNPAILAEAADAWDKQAAQNQQSMVQEAIKKNHAALYEDAYSPRLGAKQPQLTLVNFTDYNCQFCKRQEADLERLMRAYPQVAVIIKPLPYRGETSMTSARYAISIWQQQPEKFAAFHETLMSKKGDHTDATLQAALKKNDLVLKAMTPESEKTMALNLALAQQMMVQGTPATLIGKQMVMGAVPYEQLEAAVKTALAEGT
ncbi:DsbA family protein [Candidatus Pantoea multigeneris]|uniref:DsbA family protein n=1 Tax=Candidatus Pantoea multigeneris TaxID=2608357 RepID=A0ABX0RE29_9GAMM|nr:DsbA family protein [Pantoea multigeneris]NIF23615.1 DsbA family protein [Pantoea multigeneris]